MALEWSAKRVREMLEQNAAGSGQASANVFFHDSVSADQLSDAAQQAVAQAAKRLGRPATLKVGLVHRLAKSVSVKGDPALIAELSNLENVKAILPSEINDIYPKPVRKRVVE
jgi:hypothetical protein